MPPISTEAFWHYSLNTYQQQNVASKCLELQDKFHLNVNLILLCGYLGQLKLDIGEVAHLETAIKDWQAQFVEPLRALRRSAKEIQNDFYNALKSAELQAEKHQQTLLIEALPLTLTEGNTWNNLQQLSSGDNTNSECLRLLHNLSADL